MSSIDPNYVAQNITTMIQIILDKIAPKKKIVSKTNHAPYLTSTTKDLMKERDLAKQKANNTQDNNNRIIYKKLRNKVVKQVKHDKQQWLQKTTQNPNTNAKQLWKAVAKITGKNNNNSITELVINDKSITKSEDIATHLNNFFITQIITIKNNLKQPPKPYVDTLKLQVSPFPEFQMLSITKDQMSKYVRELKNSGASGSDGIPAFVLKDIYEVWNQEILHMVNLSLCTGVFPECLKITKILPTLKKGKVPSDPASYRPISSLNMLGKLLERSGFDQLASHCELYNIISQDQHGGRVNHSTATCLMELHEANQTEAEAGLKCATLAIDASSAYNLCSHLVLDQQIRLAGASPLFRQWTQSFLGGRTQQVEVEGCSCKSIGSLCMGLCQGGRSSGLLFALHTNNIPKAANNPTFFQPQQHQPTTTTTKHIKPAKAINNINTASDQASLPPQQQQQPITTTTNNTKRTKRKKINNKGTTTTKQFIDDTTAMVSAPTNEELGTKLQNTYNNIEQHLVELGMAINPTKTQLMIHKPNDDGKLITIQAGGKTITHQPILKVLGFTFSDNQKMDMFIWKGPNNLIRSINAKTHMLRVIRPFTSQKQLANIGNLTINSQIRYLATLWSLTGTVNIAKIQAAQTKAARAITWQGARGSKNKISRQDLLNSLGWMNVQQIADSASLMMVRQATLNSSAIGINHMFNINIGRLKRAQFQNIISTKNTKKRKGVNFLDRGRDLFNELPVLLRDTKVSKFTFKKGVKSYISDRHHLPRHN